MNIREKILNLKLFKLFLINNKNKDKDIITTHELAKLLLEEDKEIPIPIYTKKEERRFIVEARTIWTNPKAKRARIIKF